MQFAIATVAFWQSVGFDCATWRKSLDGTLAICHVEYSEVLVPDAAINPNITAYDCPGDALTALLSSAAWKPSSIGG